MFVGRDALFYDLEAAARLQKVVVLAGPGGTGKTELAKAFGRWWRDTGGVERPEWVFWHSFEPGVATFGLDGVITEIGLALYGEQFALLEPAQRPRVVLEALAEHRMLLIWDNFESVRSMPDPAARRRRWMRPAARAAGVPGDGGRGRAERGAGHQPDGRGLARRLSAGSAVGGLAAHEAAEYAEHLLAPYPAARQRRESRAFGDLMQWLDGHPLSMRLVLPRLDSDSPEALLAGLQGTAPLPGGDDGRRPEPVTGGQPRLLLRPPGPGPPAAAAAVCLFHDTADADVLGAFSATATCRQRFPGRSEEDWAAALDDAARVGLLTRPRRRHVPDPPRPARLPGRRVAAEDTADYDTAAGRRHPGAASRARRPRPLARQQISSGDAGLAYTVIGLEHRTMGTCSATPSATALWAPGTGDRPAA